MQPMFSKEKIVIRFNRILRIIFFHFFFWFASFLFYAFLTGENQIFKVYLNFLEVDNTYLVMTVLSIFIAVLFSIIDGLFPYRFRRFFPRRLITFFKSILFLASAFILILIAARLPLTTFTETNYTEILNQIPDMNIHFVRFLVYFYVSGFLITLFHEMIRRVGRRNIRNWVFGLLNRPVEQERIFMFVDMKKSTTIAEKLGHKKFSHLVQDVFNDMAVVDNYRGEIYQYLGDGAIISWSIKDGTTRLNCLKAFVAFNRLVQRRSRYYNRRYGFVPEFKAGMHAGKVMVLQVGQIRRDISYNGDTINTAARIESVCNDYRATLLISGELYNMLPENKIFNFRKLDNIKLKGKRRGVDIYTVKVSQRKK